MLLWLLVWVVLLLVAAGVLFLSGRMLWRKVKALGRELAAAGERMASAGELLEAVDRSRREPELAVFADPVVLRREAGRGPGGRARRAGR
jgi:hypothetical protein